MKSTVASLTVGWPIASFLALTFFITWTTVFYVGAGEAGILSYQPSELWLALIGQFGPLWAVLILVTLQKGRSGLLPMFKKAWHFNVDASVWWIAVLFAPIGFLCTYSLFSVVSGGTLTFEKVVWGEAMVGVLIGTLIGMIFGGLSEEFGWRGILLPKLQQGLHPILAGVLVGIVWSLWHLEPKTIAILLSQGFSAFLAEWLPYQFRYFIETIPFSIFMVALYNRTGGNLFIMILVHAISNAFTSAFWSNWAPIPDALRYWDVAVMLSLAIGLSLWWSTFEKQTKTILDA